MARESDELPVSNIEVFRMTPLSTQQMKAKESTLIRCE
jgi:hypothetical protein